jgi:EmrB/QacA subfamily drug resistance transporter
MSAGPAPAQRASDPNRWWTLAVVCVAIFMLLLDVTIVNVALPAIQRSLHSSFSDLQWVVDAYALTLAALLLTTGSLADLFGRKKLYLLGLVVFTLSSLLCGLANGSLFLEIARGAQGVGGAIMFSVSLALLADAFQGKERGVAFGIWGAITGLAVAIGPLLGGVLTSGLSWRWIFFVNLPLGVVAVFITLRKVHESRAEHARRPDWWGVVTFTAALAALVYALIESNQRSFGDTLVVACFIASGVLLVAFLLIERFGRHPMFDLSLFRLPTFSGGLIAAFGISASIFSLLLYLVLYVQDLLGYSPLQTGLRVLVLSGGILLTSTVSGRLSSHVPVRLLVGPGLLLVGAGIFLMRGLDASASWTHLIPGFIVAGAGIGLTNPPLASTAVGVVEPARAGMASGINSTFRQVGIATGIALLGTLFASKTTSVVREQLASVPGVGSRSGDIATALQSGELGPTISKLPASARGDVAQAAKVAFTSGLNEILLVGGIIAVTAGVLALLLIRTRDFAGSSAPAAG